MPSRGGAVWLAAAEISTGPVFRAVALGGKVSDAALTPDSAARVVKKDAGAVGLDAAACSGHSLRAGMSLQTYRLIVPLAGIGLSLVGWLALWLTRDHKRDRVSAGARRAHLSPHHADQSTQAKLTSPWSIWLRFPRPDRGERLRCPSPGW